VRAEAFFGLDLFGTFCIKAKSTERRLHDDLQKDPNLSFDNELISTLQNQRNLTSLSYNFI